MSKGRLIYSTGPGGPVSDPGCSGNGSSVSTPAPEVLAPARHQVRVRIERAGRGGKTVTTIQPLFVARETAQELLGRFKKLCGTGGTLKDGAAPNGARFFLLEVQGDHADRIVAELGSLGYPAKRAGG